MSGTLEVTLPVNCLVRNLRLGLGDPEQIGGKLLPSHKIQDRSAAGYTLELPQIDKIHVVHAAISCILEERIVLNPSSVGGRAKRTFAFRDLIPNLNALDIVRPLDIVPKRLRHRDKVGLCGRHLWLADITVDRHEITREASQLEVRNGLGTQFPLNLAEVLGNLKVQRGASSDCPVDWLAEGLKAFVTQHPHEVSRIPKLSAIVSAQILEARTILFEVEQIHLVRTSHLVPSYTIHPGVSSLCNHR